MCERLPRMLCERINYPDTKAEDEPDLPLQSLRSQNYSGKEIRYWLLMNHYRKPARFSPGNFRNAVQGYRRIIEFYHRVQTLPNQNKTDNQLSDLLFLLEQKFFDALSNDLNTPQALSAIFKFIRDVNPILENGEFNETQRNHTLKIMKKLDQVLGILDDVETRLNQKEEKLLQQREAARKAKNWQEADRLRDELARLGILVKDTAGGTVWERIGYTPAAIIN
jgi:cysteinyl-tRNA synthetase